MSGFVPGDFVAPLRWETADFLLEKLTVEHTERDYDAVMSSRESLRHIFSPADDWPADGMTLEENRADLQRHDEHFESRRGFTYTVLTPDATECIGCLYIYDWSGEAYGGQVYYWVRDSVKPQGMEEKFGEFVRSWLAKEWPIERPALPGRDVDWQTWQALEAEIKND